MNWKRIQIGLSIVALSAGVAVMCLLQWQASTSPHAFANSAHPIRHQFGAIVFYVSDGIEFWIKGLTIIFGAALFGGLALTLLLGNSNTRPR